MKEQRFTAVVECDKCKSRIENKFSTVSEVHDIMNLTKKQAKNNNWLVEKTVVNCPTCKNTGV